jgi:uncharacterized protein (TIGR02246 family)
LRALRRFKSSRSEKEDAMRFTNVKAVLPVLLLVVVAAGATWARPADGSAADSAAIKKLFGDFNDAFNKHDAHAASMQFTDDGDFITIQGATTTGKAEVEQHLAPLFADRLKAAHREVTLRGIKFLRPDVATIDSDYVMTGLAGPNGSSLPPNKGLYDWIVTKQNGKWLIAVWHESNLPVAPPAAPPAK